MLVSKMRKDVVLKNKEKEKEKICFPEKTDFITKWGVELTKDNCSSKFCSFASEVNASFYSYLHSSQKLYFSLRNFVVCIACYIEDNQSCFSVTHAA